jgi:type I restriction enzyme S subunit
MMQQLLTGKKRLKGFQMEWKMVMLGDLFSERNETNHSNLPLLSIGQNGVYLQTESNKRDISNDDKSKYKRICIGDIGYNTMRLWQGRYALSSLEGIISPAYTVIIPNNKANGTFFSYLFGMSHIIYAFWTHSQGLVSDTLNCKYPDFATISIKIPSLAEQIAIANILSSADAEIDLAQKKLAAFKTQKKGLMQVLLTGKRMVQTISSK